MRPELYSKSFDGTGTGTGPGSQPTSRPASTKRAAHSLCPEDLGSSMDAGAFAS